MRIDLTVRTRTCELNSILALSRLTKNLESLRRKTVYWREEEITVCARKNRKQSNKLNAESNNKLITAQNAIRQSAKCLHHRALARQREVYCRRYGIEVRNRKKNILCGLWLTSGSLFTFSYFSVLQTACDVFSSLKRQRLRSIGCSWSRTRQF